MKHQHTIFAALAAAAFAVAATAQDAVPEDAVGNEAAVERKSVQDVVQEYLDAKGWSGGKTPRRTAPASTSPSATGPSRPRSTAAVARIRA